MHTSVSPNKLARRTIAAVAVGALAIVSGCSSSNRNGNGDGHSAGSTAATSGPATGRTNAAALLDPKAANFDYSKFVPTAPAQLKKDARVAIITSSLASAQAVQFAAAAKAAVSAAGWRPTVYDGQYSVTTQSSLISQAVNSKVDGIILMGVAPTTVASPVAAARAANIPVIGFTGYGDENNGVTDIGTDPVLAGKAVGQWLIADSGGKAKVAVFTLPAGGAASVAINAYQNAMSSELATCSGCKVIHATMDVTDATAPGTPRYVAFLNSHPKGSIDYVAPGFDTGMINYAKADTQVGRTEIKTVGGYAVSGDGVAQIVAKAGPVVSVAVPLPFVAYASVDTIARRMAGQSISNIGLPAPLITATNASALPKGVFSGSVDYAQKFQQLWK